MKSLNIDNEIVELVARFVTELKGFNAIDRTDINRVAQNLFVPVFDEVYGYKNLRNLDIGSSTNFPGVDLGDDSARVAIQVTSTKTLGKVKETLCQFIGNNLDLRYDRLIVFILTEKQRSYSQNSCDALVKRDFRFSVRSDILDYRDLLRDIQSFSASKKRRVLEILREHLDGSQRLLDSLRISTLAKAAIKVFRGSVVDSWNQNWRVTEQQHNEDSPPFIATQGLRILGRHRNNIKARLAINTAVYRRTRDEQFSGDRRKPDKPVHRKRSDLAINPVVQVSETWREILRDELVMRLVNFEEQHIHRLVVSSDAGLGKTTNMRWLHKEINQADDTSTAFLLNVAELPDVHCQSLDQLLATFVLHSKGNEGADVSTNDLERLILERRKEGKIILLVDALDQVDLNSTSSLQRLKYLLADHRWSSCPIVLGSRPFALDRDWEELFVSDAAPGWDIVQIDEFTTKQQREYLGDVRYEYIPQGAKEILSVPRVLYYLRSTPDEEFDKIRTPSDVYWLSTTRLLVDGLRAQESQSLHPDAARLLLGAIAFQMSIGNSNFDHIGEGEISHFLNGVASRCCTFNDAYGLDWVHKTIRQIVAMNEFLAHAILEAGFPRQVRWRNRSLQEFFAALWVSKYASDPDIAKISLWQYSNCADTQDFYWIWRFSVEMPSVGRTKTCWLKLVSPLLDREHSRQLKRPRPTEMIHRSWDTLVEYMSQYNEDSHDEAELQAKEGMVRFSNEFKDIICGRRGFKARRIAAQMLNGFVLIPPNRDTDAPIRFQVGSSVAEIGRGKNEPLHWRELKSDYLLSCFAVTAEQLELFDEYHIGKADHGRWRPRCPAIHVTWYDASIFCLWLGDGYRLPNEAEWEFACRAGTTTAYSFGDTAHYLRRYAHCGVQALGVTIPVGCLKANPWGLYDMHGNTWEWCEDWYVHDPTGRSNQRSGERSRVVRGGACNTSRYRVRSAERAFRDPSDDTGAIGFRVVQEVNSEPPIKPGSSDTN
ncbi:MAG: SUMF1/EgtB/PvdO family nonheme iron enzyme [Rubripirellula sp.]